MTSFIVISCKLDEEIQMALYSGIDLHGNNNVTLLLDEHDRVIYQKRLPNQLARILEQLAPYQADIVGVVVESTFNWYWLVDGLMDAGYRVHLANPSAIQQYSGLKHTDDHSDARWLAHLLRLGVLPEGYIYPKAQRPLRDLLRKRGHLVEQQTSNVLSVQNIIARNTGTRLRVKEIKQLTQDEVDALLPNDNQALAVSSGLRVIACLAEQIKLVEKRVQSQIKKTPLYELLQSVNGIGPILAQTILLETGDIRRFPRVGDYASYCRLVDSTKLSNGKRKGKGNAKNGNEYLSWAYSEAAHFAIQYHPKIEHFYQRKASKTKVPVAYRSVAHKLSRACYHIMRDEVPFDVAKAFG
jgi:transposase